MALAYPIHPPEVRVAEKKRTTVKVKALTKSAGKKAKDVKGGMLPGTDDKTACCRTICTHRHCNN